MENIFPLFMSCALYRSLRRAFIKKFAFKKIFIAELFCCEPKHHTAVGTYDILAVLAAASDIREISAASDGFHNREEHHHKLRADAVSVLIDRAAVGADVLVPDFLAVAAVAFRMGAAEKACHFDCEI